MEKVKKVTGFFEDKPGDNVQIEGIVELLEINDKTYKLSWRIFFPNGNLVAGRGRSFFYGGLPMPSEDEVFGNGIKDILNYRIGRRKVFSNINFTH